MPLQNKHQLRRSEKCLRQVGKASIEGVTAAAANLKQMPADYRSQYQRSGRNLLPHLQLHLFVIPFTPLNPAKGKCHQGSAELDRQVRRGEVTALSYAPLPAKLAEKELRASTRCSRDRRAVRLCAPDLLCCNQPPAVTVARKLATIRGGGVQ